MMINYNAPNTKQLQISLWKSAELIYVLSKCKERSRITHLNLDEERGQSSHQKQNRPCIR